MWLFNDVSLALVLVAIWCATLGATLLAATQAGLEVYRSGPILKL